MISYYILRTLQKSSVVMVAITDDFHTVHHVHYQLLKYKYGNDFIGGDVHDVQLSTVRRYFIIQLQLFIIIIITIILFSFNSRCLVFTREAYCFCIFVHTNMIQDTLSKKGTYSIKMTRTIVRYAKHDCSWEFRDFLNTRTSIE